ncbi:MAG: RNA-guided pseudouridylation complex pseudouridine synthase subunit Cbf5 [Thermoplasmata archaeon]
MLVKTEAVTDERYGKEPAKRSIEEHIRLGVVVLDKPAGPTSHQVSAWVKDILHIEKAGHGGTLDPKVTGVLPIALEDATKAVGTLLVGDKEYVALMRLHKKVDEKEIREVFSEFTGQIYQLPPVRSAVKRQIRKRWIYEMDILEIEGNYVLFRVSCEAGTYIRTLCNDIGEVLGVGAQMSELRRTRTATLTEDEAVTLHELKDAYVDWKENGEEKYIRNAIKPVEVLFAHVPQIFVKDSAVDAIAHGADVSVKGVVKLHEKISREDLVAVMSLKGEGVALGKALMTSREILEKEEGICVNTERVIMRPGVYPKMWRTQKQKETKTE